MKLHFIFDASFKHAFLQPLEKEEILQLYHGGLNSETIHCICNQLEKKLKQKKFQKLVIKRTFFLALEIIQNQLLHGSLDENKFQYNYFICTADEKKINLRACNLIKNDEIGSIKERIRHVNELLIEKKLQPFYLEQLNNENFSNKGGGGLGFIKMALVTGNTVEHEIIEGNEDYSFLNVSVALSHSSLDNSNNINFDEVLSLLK
jgi:Family of unknown function (DUF6272)